MRSLIVAVCLVPLVVLADAPGVPMVVSHHGRLLGPSDAPATGTHDMKFTLYDIPNPLGDNPGRVVWTSTYSVRVDEEGAFAVMLGGAGSSAPLTTDVFPSGEDRYLSVDVDGLTLSPRTRLGSVPFAVRAALADSARKADTATNALHADVADVADLATVARGIECAGGATSCVSGALLTAGSVPASALVPGGIDSSVLGAGSVTGSAIAAGAVGTSQLANGAVTAAKIDRTGLDADSVDGFSASATATAGQLLALGSDGKFPGSVLGTSGAPFAAIDHRHSSESYLRGAQLGGSDATLTGMALVTGRLKLAGGGYGAGRTDLEVTAANSPFLLPEGVNEYRNVYVRAGGTLTVPAWNGKEGGRVQIRATGEVLIEGTINVAAKGYRGGLAFHRSVTNQWLPVDMEWGQGGESIDGEASERAPLVANRGGGGGGGLDPCSYGSAGGGGSYGTAGTAGRGGKDNTSTCAYGVQVLPSQPNAPQPTPAGAGGSAGALYGDAAISSLHLGSGGGSSATDADCIGGRGGHGGRGGGAVGIDAASIVVKGSIVVDGEKGGDRVAGSNACSYAGDNGGGGGGSGGSIRLRANRIVVDAAGRLSARGGAAGVGIPELPGGAGGDGRVRLEGADVSSLGAIDVAVSAKSIMNAADQGQGDATYGRWVSPLVTFEGAGHVRVLDLFAVRGDATTVLAEVCAAVDAAGTTADANCVPVAPSGAVDAPEGARFARVRLEVFDRANPRRFSLSGIRLEYGP